MISEPVCEDDRAQLGLGTMIVFVSLVIIGAMAAAVLIGTGGLVQTHAEATGEESTQQVADRIEIVNAVGYTDNSIDDFDHTDIDGLNEEVHRLEVTVKPAPGTEVLDLSEATVDLLGAESETLTYRDVSFDEDDFGEETALTTEDSNFFAIREIGTKESINVLSEDTQGTIVIPLGAYDDDSEWIDNDPVEQPDRLADGETAEFTITTAQGSQTTMTLDVPRNIRDEPAVSL